MNTSITPGTTLDRETSLNQKIKKKLTCNFSNFIFLLIFSYIGFYFCKISRNEKIPNYHDFYVGYEMSWFSVKHPIFSVPKAKPLRSLEFRTF